jgi:hypothetical protein
MTESQEQIEVFRWAATMAQHPQLAWLHHIPNGGSRGDTPASRAIRGARLAAEGVRPGVADIFLPAPGRGGCGLYIEMKAKNKKLKTKDGGGLSTKQLEFAEFVSKNEYKWVCCYGADEAIKEIKKYLDIHDPAAL